MRAIGWKPDRVDSRNDPLAVIRSNGQQPANRAEDLTTGVAMRPGDTRDLAGQLDGEQHRAVGRFSFCRIKKRSGHGRKTLWNGFYTAAPGLRTIYRVTG